MCVTQSSGNVIAVIPLRFVVYASSYTTQLRFVGVSAAPYWYITDNTTLIKQYTYGYMTHPFILLWM